MIRRKMCDSINTLLTKLLRSKQLLLFLLSKTKDGVRFPVWKLGATCSLFTNLSQLYRGSSSVGRAAILRLARQKARVGSSPTFPTYCPVSLMAKHRVDIADTHARFVYGVRSSIGEVAQLAEQQTWYASSGRKNRLAFAVVCRWFDSNPPHRN